MDKSGLITLLKAGNINEFNRYREEHPDTEIDLTDANLSDATLTGADLRDADFTGANLSDAYLSYASLTGASLTGGNLMGANLSAATLTGADLRDADFTGANLSDADFTGADLRDAYLRGADLRDAYLRGADLRDAYLRDADLTGATLTGASLTGAKGLPDAPAIKDLDGCILKMIETDEYTIDMSYWHTCETTHCRAGFAILLAGEQGKVLEDHYGPSVAGALIYNASCPDLPVPDFVASEEDAIEDMKTRSNAPT